MTLCNKIKPCLWFLVFSGVFLIPVTDLCAESSPLHVVSEKAKALVGIYSLNATVLAGASAAGFDKSTGAVLSARRIQPVTYERTGSGIIIDPRGIIVTNAHIVRGAGRIAVTFFDGARVEVKQTYVVPDNDIAFIAIDPPFKLPLISFANPDTITVGESVYTVGHSEWVKGALTGGSITGIKNEEINGMSRMTFLRVSFSLYQGDSGSPILDSEGNLLGMVSAGRIGEKQSETFAISSVMLEMAYRQSLENFKNQ